jgi:heme/copper-type cytochrome/quinol oxidase subunit 2
MAPDRSASRKATPRARLALLGSQTVLLATSAAVSKDIGLLATFVGIGIIVGVIAVFIAFQVRGERRQNQEYLERHRHGL